MQWVYLNMLMSMGQQEGGQEPNMLISLLPFVAIIAIFYFLFIRPQQKQRKQTDKMLSSLQKGDKVLTSGGLIGSIVGVGENTITIKFGEGFKTEVGKSYIVSKMER